MRRKNKTSNSHLKLTRFLTCVIALCKCWLMTNPSVAVHHTISPVRLTVVVIFFCVLVSLLAKCSTFLVSANAEAVVGG